eukprot:8173641-Ditylum_brightwellii.AAC.1
MTKTGRGNIKTSPSRVTRDITVRENVIKEKERFFVRLSWSVLPWHGQVQLCAEPQEARSAHALYHRTAEAPAGP